MSEFILNNQIAFYYSLIGAAFLVLTFEPALRSKFFFNIPILYIAVGVLSALIGLPIINPLNSDLELSIVVHMSEMIVIISLAGAGLSIDLKAGWERWQTTWRLLAITMPLTILSVMFLGDVRGGSKRRPRLSICLACHWTSRYERKFTVKYERKFTAK
jgi:NhaP-type Na+/H+ or K+/H+ antiporter